MSKKKIRRGDLVLLTPKDKSEENGRVSGFVGDLNLHLGRIELSHEEPEFPLYESRGNAGLTGYLPLPALSRGDRSYSMSSYDVQVIRKGRENVGEKKNTYDRTYEALESLASAVGNIKKGSINMVLRGAEESAKGIEKCARRVREYLANQEKGAVYQGKRVSMNKKEE